MGAPRLDGVHLLSRPRDPREVVGVVDATGRVVEGEVARLSPGGTRPWFPAARAPTSIVRADVT